MVRLKQLSHSWKSKVNKLNKILTHCPCCGDELTKENPLTVDHIWPKSRGGIDHPINYQLICRRCNNIKGNNIPNNSDIVNLLSDLKNLIRHCISMRISRVDMNALYSLRHNLIKNINKSKLDVDIMNSLG